MRKYEAAFGAADVTGSTMADAISRWYDLYYGKCADGSDPGQRIAYTVVNKIVKTVFGEYAPKGSTELAQAVCRALEPVRKLAVQEALVGGECYLKPVFGENSLEFRLLRRPNVLIFGMDAQGAVTDMGCVEKSTVGKYYYTLLERRTLDKNGYLTVQNQLLRSLDPAMPGNPVSLTEHPAYRKLPASFTYPEPLGSIGLVTVRTPMLNCVDGSCQGVSVFAAAADLIDIIDRNEALLRGEFERGQSRLLVSADLLGAQGLEDNVFVGLDEDPQSVGITAFAPQLREKSYLEAKQEYLRNVESIIGLKRGMLCDSNDLDRTATEIAASAADFNLTVMDFQHMWQGAVDRAVALCAALGRVHGFAGEPGAVSVDWGNGVLYDEDKTWEQYRQMVADGILKPEIALAWRFGLAADTPEQLRAVREKLMPE